MFDTILNSWNYMWIEWYFAANSVDSRNRAFYVEYALYHDSLYIPQAGVG